MPRNVWNEIIYPFQNFNGATVEVWESVYNFIRHFIMDVITYLCWDLSWTMLVKETPGGTDNLFARDTVLFQVLFTGSQLTRRQSFCQFDENMKALN